MDKAGKPNILHIFTDQQRGDTIGALGNPVIKTPNLDRLVREGTAFVNAFSPSPVCIAARCSMVYGQYPLHTGCYENTVMPEDGRQSLMDALNNAGYLTYGIGKCHFSPDPHARRGFQKRERQEEIVKGPEEDEFLKCLHDNGYGYICDPHGIRSEMYYIPQPSQLPAKWHPTQWIGDRTERFIQKRAGKHQPWYLFTSFIHPHPPFTPPNPWHKLYRLTDMPHPNVPEHPERLLTYVNRVQNRYKYRDQGIDRNLVRTLKVYYYSCISFIDYQVGRILRALEKTGQLDNTLVLYASDHGEHLGDYHCFGKRSMHDTAARVPLLVRYPVAFKPGTRCTVPVSLVDVAPTLLTAAGAHITSHVLDGRDLGDIAGGRLDREMVFSQLAWNPHPTARDRAELSTYMAVSRDWKYFYSAPDNREYLFNRQTDPKETINCADMPECGHAIAAIKQALIRHLTEGGETGGLEGNNWKRTPIKNIPSDPDKGLIRQDHRWAATAIPGYTDNKKPD